MNILLLSTLILVSAEDFLELPIFRNSTKVTAAAKDGSTGVSFNRESLYANILVGEKSYLTHLEPENGDLWVFEDSPSKECKPHAPTKENLDRMGIKQDMGMYYTDMIKFDKARFIMAYAQINRKLAMNDPKVGGLGLGPKKSATFKFPMRNGENRDWYANFADLIKSKGLAQSDAFTINFAADPSNEDKLVYGAMDLSRYTGKLKALYRSPSNNLITPTFTINGITTNASLEIEDPNTYLDDEVVAKVAKELGAEWDEDHGLYGICAMPQNDIVLNFDGLEIRVPPADIWVQDEKVDEKWYLTIRPLSSYTLMPRNATLGADILQSAYIVYDLGHDRVAIGQANRNPGPAKYEVIPAEGIPEVFLS